MRIYFIVFLILVLLTSKVHADWLLAINTQDIDNMLAVDSPDSQAVHTQLTFRRPLISGQGCASDKAVVVEASLDRPVLGYLKPLRHTKKTVYFNVAAPMAGESLCRLQWVDL